MRDEYVLGKNGSIESLTRSIVHLTYSVEEEQRFAFELGRAVKKSTTTRYLRSGEPAPSLPGRWEFKPIVSTAADFPFWSFIKTQSERILASKKVCVADQKR